MHPSKNLITTLAVLAALAGGCSGDDDQPLADALPADGAPGADAAVPTPDAAAPQGQLQRLAAWMTGSFSSAQQSQQDPTYYNITLSMKRIWANQKAGGYWLYVEQAVAGQQPYRQRVYRLEHAGPNSYASRVYLLATPQLEAQAVGAWKQQNPLATLTEQDLQEKQGCAVYLSWQPDQQQFQGSTEPQQCATTYQGASYTTSEVAVTATRLTSWDRGFDTSGAQVWGATGGPYAFDKLQNLDPGLAPTP